jgi:hypothetical protein
MILKSYYLLIYFRVGHKSSLFSAFRGTENSFTCLLDGEAVGGDS